MKTITKSVLLALTLLGANTIHNVSAAPVLESRHAKNLWLKISADTNGLFTPQASLKSQMVFDMKTNTSADHVFDTQGSVADNLVDVVNKIPGLTNALPYVDFNDLSAKLNQLASDEATIAATYNNLDFEDFYRFTGFFAQLNQSSALNQYLSAAGDPKGQANAMHANDPTYALAIYLRSDAAAISDPTIPAVIDSTNIQQVKEIIKKAYTWKWTIDPAGKAALMDLKTKVATYLNNEKIPSGWVSILYNININGQPFTTSSYLDMSRSDYTKLIAGTDTMNFVGFNVITPTGLTPSTVPLTNKIEATYKVASQYPDFTADATNKTFLGLDSIANIQANGYGIISYIVKDSSGNIIKNDTINVSGVYDDLYPTAGTDYTINNLLPERDSSGIRCLVNKYTSDATGNPLCRSRHFKDIKGLMADNSANEAIVKYIGRFELEHNTSTTVDGLPKGTFNVLTRNVSYAECKDFTLSQVFEANFYLRQLQSTYNVKYDGTNVSYAYATVNPQSWIYNNVALPSAITYSKTITYPRYMDVSDPLDYETFAEEHAIIDPSMSSSSIVSNSNHGVSISQSTASRNDYMIDTSDADAAGWLTQLSSGLVTDIHPNKPAGSLGKSRDFTSGCLSSIQKYPVASSYEPSSINYVTSAPSSFTTTNVGHYSIGYYASYVSGSGSCTKRVYNITNVVNTPAVVACPSPTCIPAIPAAASYDTVTVGLVDTKNYNACRETCPFGGTNTAITHPCPSNLN